jgi:hypothetical protein
VRPNFIKSKPEPTLPTQEDDSEDDQDGVPETQVTGDAVDDLDSDSEESDYASDASHTPRRNKATTTKPKEQDEAKESTVKKVGRKIKATAHANYRRLKIKGTGTANVKKGKFSRRR